MDGEGARLAEAFAAVIALEGLLFGMNVAMISQMILATEGFAANVTAVRTLVSVRSFMDQKIVGFGELAIAILADELFLWARSSRASDFQWTHAIACYRW